MPYFVSRQHYYYSDQFVVEVAAGGLDCAGSDMLCEIWDKIGEGKEFQDPREAVKAAIKIRQEWLKKRPEVKLAVGNTGGLLTEMSDTCDEQEAIAWAEKQYERLEKCSQCGEVLGKETYKPFPCDEKFCSEFCVEQWFQQIEVNNG